MYVMAAVLPVCYISSTFLIQLYGIQGALYSGVVCASIIAVLFALKIYKISKWKKLFSLIWWGKSALNCLRKECLELFEEG